MNESTTSLVNLKFKPFASATAHAYRLAFYFGAQPPERLRAEGARMLEQK
ncbi:MAG: hypothetical protein AAB401_20630 [Acidobacteriota bacterium]